MERAVAVSRTLVRSTSVYASVVRTPPGGATQTHHHGECETVIYVLSGRARITYGSPQGAASPDELIADAGDFVYIPAREVHAEANVSLTEPLEVIVMRNCPEPVTVIVE